MMLLRTGADYPPYQRPRNQTLYHERVTALRRRAGLRAGWSGHLIARPAPFVIFRLVTGEPGRRPARSARHYLPMQNREKITPSRSSAPNSPVMLANAS